MNACSKDIISSNTQDFNNQDFNKDLTFILANISDYTIESWDDQSETRTTLSYDGNYSIVSWNTGDMIGATVRGNSAYSEDNVKFSLISGAFDPAGITAGVFTSELYSLNDNSIYRFYYPFNENAIIDGKVIFNMPTQIVTGSHSQENNTVCDFMYSKDTITATSSQQRLEGNHISELDFFHATAAITFSISLPVGETLYSFELRSATGEDIFPHELAMSFDKSMEYSDFRPSVPLYIGKNGYTFTQNDEIFLGRILTLPVSFSEGKPIQFCIHTSEGFYVLNKTLRSLAANGSYPLSLDKALMTKETDNPPIILNDTLYIRNIANLKWVSDFSNDPNKTSNYISDKTFLNYTIMLVNNINIGSLNWIPINTFKGTFDGNGQSIEDITIPSSTVSTGLGLFSVNDGGTIKNLTINSPSISTRATNVGAIVGICNSGTIQNCHVNGGRVAGARNVGGIVGSLISNQTTFTNCTVTGTSTTGAANNTGAYCGSPLMNSL